MRLPIGRRLSPTDTILSPIALITSCPKGIYKKAHESLISEKHSLKIAALDHEDMYFNH